MISFSTKPRSTKRSTVTLRSSTAGVVQGLAALAAAEPARDDEVADLERLTEAAAFRRSWHDSSLDLRRGLDVTEEVPIDTLPAELRDSLFGGLR
jgi:hypothetical protein